MADDYGTWTCPKIKLELAKRGARTTGTKTQLVERLRAYDRNQDFLTSGVVLITPDDLKMPAWPHEGAFRSMMEDQKNSLPPLLTEHLQQYVVHRQGLDKKSTNDIKALKKGKLVAEDSVAALSWYSDQNYSYISGVVNASMKKKVSYSVKVVLEQSGEVRNSHCECPGGIGPHGTCKHIVACLFVLADFRSTGVLKVTKSCTETLQSFHRPKQLHSGSPVKAENLGGKVNKADDDPRPVFLRNRPEYTEQVMMKVINFSYHSGIDVALRYMGLKADLSAAAADHDYLQRDFRTY